MNPDELRSTVLEALTKVAPEVDPAKIESDATFHDQFDIDSLDFLNLMLELERRLEVRISETDYPKLANLEGCVAYLEHLLAQRTVAG
jgi:acyl carrier protein